MIFTFKLKKKLYDLCQYFSPFTGSSWIIIQHTRKPLVNCSNWELKIENELFKRLVCRTYAVAQRLYVVQWKKKSKETSVILWLYDFFCQFEQYILAWCWLWSFMSFGKMNLLQWSRKVKNIKNSTKLSSKKFVKKILKE